MGGAQAIAALALRHRVACAAVDVIAGPGQRVRAGGQAPGGRDRWGSTGWPGPASWWWWPRAGADPELDRAGPAGPGRARRRQPALALSPDAGLLDAVARRRGALAAERPSVADARAPAGARAATPRGACGSPTRSRPSTSSWWASEAEALAGPRAARRLCVRGPGRRPRRSATTWPARTTCCPPAAPARFQSALSPATFRRRMARVSLPGEAAARLAPAGAALARAEGFPVHAESMERRA